MCRSCYLLKGRFKKAECEHSDKPMYAKGLCLKCYRLDYMTKRSNELHKEIKEPNNGNDEKLIYKEEN